MYSHTGNRNLTYIAPTSSKNSGDTIRPTNGESSSSTKQLEKRSGEGKTVRSSTGISERTSTNAFSTPTESNIRVLPPKLLNERSYATNSMERLGATTHLAFMNTNVEVAKKPDMDSRDVTSQRLKERGERPRYLRYNRWNVQGEPIPGVVEWSEHADPLPCPLELSCGHVTCQTVHSRHDLFKVITPINVAHFHEYLRHHPNQPFVKSVCDGLKDSFWPWADMDQKGFPCINDQTQSPPKMEEMRQFL